MAVQAGLPIIPVIANNYSNIFNWRNRRFNGGDVYIKGKSHTSLSSREEVH